MLFRIKTITLAIATSSMLLLTLCLGSQNLHDRHSINLGFTRTAPLPSGFIGGISLILGVLSGSAITSILIKESNK